MRQTTVLLFLWLLSQTAKAQQNELNFLHFGAIDGLSSNTVNAIGKDRFGYMWFATEDGLTRFDGTTFKVYNHNEGDTASLGTNQMQTLYEDRQGNLWVGTNRTLSLYDRKQDCFHNYDLAYGTAVRSICGDDSGRLWIGSYSGLVLFDPVTRHVSRFVADSTAPGHLLTNIVLCVFRDSRRRLWVGTNKGLYLYQAATRRFRCFVNVPGDPTSISDNVIRTIAEDENGHLWFGTISGGLDLLQPDGEHFRRFKAGGADEGSLSSNRIYAVVPDRAGKLWIGTEQGLNIFDLGTFRVDRVRGDDRNKYSLKGTSVRSIFIDQRGMYWVGTVQGGINKYDRNLAFFHLVGYNPFDPLGLSCPKVTSFAEAGNGDLYVGTDGGGLNIFHRKTGLSGHVPLPDNDPNARLQILALERKGHQLWIGTFQHGVYVLDTRNNQVRHYGKGDRPQDLPGDEIFCIRKDSRGNIWLGTNGKGVCMYDPQRDVFRRFGAVPATDGNTSLLADGFIRAIEEDGQGNMLIGTVGAGLVLYDPVHNNCRIFNRANTHLPLDEVIALHIDGKGIIWAGTPSGGLCRLDIAKHQFVHYSEQQGLASAVVCKILEDDTGNLWMGTNKGISCFRPSTVSFRNYTADNGLQQSSFNLGAGFKAPSGEFYFGGIDGFNYFLPAALKDNRNVPAIVFTDFKIGGRSILPGKEAAITENIAMAREVRLDYRQNFSLDFTALDYTTPREDRYMYKLDGLDRSWNQLGAGRTAAFTNLYPGDYTLEVRARNANGEWTTPPAVIHIVVKPPFWLTQYAYAAYVLLAGLLLWGIRYRGIRKLKARFALEQERTRMKQLIEQERREAERLHEFDQLRIKFLTNLSHEFRTPVSLITGPIARLHETEADPEKREQLGMAKRNARRLLNLVNQLLDFRKLEEQESKLNCTEGDIVPFLKEAAESFRDIADRKQIHFSVRTTLTSFYSSFDRDKIERVVFNLLGNAFKFTGKEGRIVLEINQPQPANGITILISDTGTGMPPGDCERIFDRFYQGNAHPGILNQGSGIGLSITKEFVRLHGGSITVDSEPGRGSTFTIHLPLENIPAPAMGPAITGADPETKDLSPETRPVAVPPLEGLTVLLVEDNEDFRFYLKDNLKTYYTIIEAADGKEGWQKALSGHPDVIVSDISMPIMDGIELSRKLRSDRRVSHIPVILLTALTEDAYQLKGLETGASDYLTKPFSFDILNLKIRNLVLLNRRLKETYTRRLSVDTPLAEVESEDEKLILRITQYIEANLDSADLSVEDLCRQVYMSHASLYRKIVDLTGETPVEFIRSIKLNKAADLLERSEMKISEIGYAVGFTTPNYFTRAFKAKFHLSPSEYVALKRKQVS